MNKTIFYFIYFCLIVICMAVSYYQGYTEGSKSWQNVFDASYNLSVSSFQGCLKLQNLSFQLYKRTVECQDFTDCQDRCLYTTRATNYSDCYWSCKDG